MAPTFDVCIRGGGVVGRTLALLLARDRLRVALVESAPSPPPFPPSPSAPPSPSVPSVPATTRDVRAYAINAAARTLLQSLRCWPDGDQVTTVQRMEVTGDRNSRVAFDADSEPLAWIVDVPALEDGLGDALRYQPQIEPVDAECPATLTVVCEGRTGRSRDTFGVQAESVAYPQQAIAARLSGTQPHRQVARQWFFPDGVLALLPVGGPEGHTVALVWSADTTRASALLAADDGAFAAAVGDASGGALGELTLVAPRATWPLHRSQATHWCGRVPGAREQSWVLAGDAAHAVHPLAGQGLNLGLADAQALADALRQRDYWRSVGDLRVLRRYERSRKAALLPVGTAIDSLQLLFSAATGPLPVLRNWGFQAFDASGPLKSWVARRAAGGQ